VQNHFIAIMSMMASLVLFGCAGGDSPPPVDTSTVSPVDPFELSIRVGRMGVMLDQGEKVLGMIADNSPTTAPAKSKDDAAARRALYAELSQQVLKHNRLWVKACATKATLTVCQKMFEPGWIGLPFSYAPTWQQLDLWSSQVEEQVGALAGDLCALAEQASGIRPQCPIE